MQPDERACALAPYAAGSDLFGLSLCTGTAGLDLGVRIACPSYRVVGYVERNAYAAAALVARMEDEALDHAPVWDDVETFDGAGWRGCVDIITAGYPCQPFSLTGKCRGAADERHLWPHIARIIAQSRPGFVFLENVAHHLRLGFPEVAGSLVSMGYRVAAGLFTAAEVGAPHKRERLFILAANVGDAACAGLARPGHEPEEHPCERVSWPPSPADEAAWERYLGDAPELEPAIRRGADGTANRMDRIQLCGNAVLPLVGAHALRILASELINS